MYRNAIKICNWDGIIMNPYNYMYYSCASTVFVSGIGWKWMEVGIVTHKEVPSLGYQ